MHVLVLLTTVATTSQDLVEISRSVVQDQHSVAASSTGATPQVQDNTRRAFVRTDPTSRKMLLLAEPRVKRAASWTLGLSAVYLVATWALQDVARARAMVGLLYIGFGVVSAPVCFLLGGFCMDSYGILGPKNDFMCKFALRCFWMLPVNLVIAGCLLCLQLDYVLLYLLPGSSPVVFASYLWVQDLMHKVELMRLPRYDPPAADSLSVPLV